MHTLLQTPVTHCSLSVSGRGLVGDRWNGLGPQGCPVSSHNTDVQRALSECQLLLCAFIIMLMPILENRKLKP